MNIQRISRPYFIGIGGAGMSALARILLAQGIPVGGSDIQSSEELTTLASLGARVYVGHASEHIDEYAPEVIVISQAAIGADNCEIIRARELRIPVIYRSDLLALLMRDQYSVAIAGTHGKTSTTALTITLLREVGKDISYAIGGRLLGENSGGYAGTSSIFVCEADESDGSFVKYQPKIAVITNIDPDHLDFYGSAQAYYESFVAFVMSIQPGGALIISLDDPWTRQLIDHCAQQLHRRGIVIYPFTLHQCRDLYAAQKYETCGEEHTEVKGKYGQEISSCEPISFVAKSQSAHDTIVQFSLLGKIYSAQVATLGDHMLVNTLAALLAGYALGENFSSLIQAIGSFPGTKRRCELRYSSSSIRIYDDYAHHPTEITAVIQGLRKQYSTNRICVIFQPHLFSRTQQFAVEFAHALSLADKVIVVDIYPAREEPIKGVSSRMIMEADTTGTIDYVPDMTIAAHTVVQQAQSGDIIITMGAGNITSMASVIAQTIGAHNNDCHPEEVFSPSGEKL